MKHHLADELLIGAHTSAAGGSFNALLAGQKIGATTVQLFTSNQKRWDGREISQEEVDLWEKALKETGLQKIMSHDSYLINLGSPNKEALHKSQMAFREEIKRCHKLKITFLNFHPGAALDSSVEECLDQIVKSLESVEDLVHQGPTRLLFESTAGQGSSVGHRFEHLGYLIERLHKKIPIGICLDTCHLFAAGYDISTSNAWEKTLEEFDRLVGLKHLFAFHLNDSVHPLGSRRDRHAHIGHGKIGMECFKTMMTHPHLREIPKYLETPEPEMWEKEIHLLREFARETHKN